MESRDRSEIEKEKPDAVAGDSKLNAAEIFPNKPVESTAVSAPATGSYGDLVLSGDRSLKTVTSEQPAANLNRENPYTSTNPSDMTNAEARSQAGKIASMERVNAANPTGVPPGQD